MTDYLPPQVSCLIDEVLPTRRIHLLGGVSDAGKTRWALPTMLDWEAGKSVLGRASYPVPWAYVVGDRTLQEAYDTMNTMGINPDRVRCIPAFGRDNKPYLKVLEDATKMTPPPQFLVWEGFQDVPPGEKKKDVRELLCNISAYCEGDKSFPNGLTILGIVESPKLKPNERYPNPRQRVSGVSAWGYHSSTILLLEGVEGDAALLRPDRVLWVCVKNGKRRQLAAAFDSRGRLTMQEAPIIRVKDKRTPISLFANN